MALVGAVFGGGRGIIGLAVTVGVFVLVFAAFDVPMHGSIGEHTYRPTTAREMGNGYEQAIGHLVVDLTAIDAPSNDSIPVKIREGIGQIEVIVPHNADVDVRSRVGAGSIRVLGDAADGGYRQDHRTHSTGSGRKFVLDAKLGFGEIAVRRAN